LHNGTSWATPLVAGVAALLVEAHPDWDPYNIMSALHLSASQATDPDTLIGWGIPDAYRAYRANLAVYGQGLVWNGEEYLPEFGTWVKLYSGEDLVRSEHVGDTGWFLFDELAAGEYHLRGFWPNETLAFDTTITIPSPPRQLFMEFDQTNAIDAPSQPERFRVGEPFPNPANPTVSIAYSVSDPIPGERVTLTVVNTVGQVVRTESIGAVAEGRVEWNGRDDLGQEVASGVYFARLGYDGVMHSRRVVLLR
jgi:hypothetical protein